MYFIFQLHRENGCDDIQLNKEVFGISAHLTAAEMKTRYGNDKRVGLQVFVVAVNPQSFTTASLNL